MGTTPKPLLEARVQRVVDALREGRGLPDVAFDRFLPRELQLVSAQYWTPLMVAARAARWLDELGVETVVDIGSGAGKFCVAAALAGRCRFIGLEQRPRLVAAARELARRFGVEDRVSFLTGAFGEIEAPAADAYYLYNPFGENLFGEEDHQDEDVELGYSRYTRDVAAVNELLKRAAVGTCLVTYNGFGGPLPACYQEVFVDYETQSVLRLSRKIAEPPPAG